MINAFRQDVIRTLINFLVPNPVHSFRHFPRIHDVFRFREARRSKWQDSIRVIQPSLSMSLINDLQSRDLTPNDYETLLNLNNTPQPHNSTALHIISNFPSTILTQSHPLVRLNRSPSSSIQYSQQSIRETCEICFEGYVTGNIVRTIPCRHVFHQSCIDRWLLLQKSTCPVCGKAAFSEIGNEAREINMANRMNDNGFIPVEFVPEILPTRVKPKPHVVDNCLRAETNDSPLPLMVIVGRSSNGLTKTGIPATPTPVQSQLPLSSLQGHPLPPLIKLIGIPQQGSGSNCITSASRKLLRPCGGSFQSARPACTQSGGLSILKGDTALISFEELVIGKGIRGAPCVARAAEPDAAIQMSSNKFKPITQIPPIAKAQGKFGDFRHRRKFPILNTGLKAYRLQSLMTHNVPTQINGVQGTSFFDLGAKVNAAKSNGCNDIQ